MFKVTNLLVELLCLMRCLASSFLYDLTSNSSYCMMSLSNLTLAALLALVGYWYSLKFSWDSQLKKVEWQEVNGRFGLRCKTLSSEKTIW